MTPEEISQAYDVLAQDVQDQAATKAAIIGNSQRSLGPLATAVASPSGQTSGLANYTYNRMLRPTVQSLSTNLITTGKAAALENTLKTALRTAKNRYEDAKNSYTASGGGSGGGSGSGGGTNQNPAIFNEQVDRDYNGTKKVTYESMPWSILNWGEANDWATGKFNWTLDILDDPNNKNSSTHKVEFELGGNAEQLKKGSDGNYYIYNTRDGSYTMITGKGGNNSNTKEGESRWWTK